MHINRLGNNSIEFEHKVVEMQLQENCEEVIEIALLNYGVPLYVQFFISDELKKTVILTENRLFIEYEEYFPIKIRTGLEKIPIIGNIYVVIENQIQNTNLDYINAKDNGFVFKLNSDSNYNASNTFSHNDQDASVHEIHEAEDNSNFDLNSQNKLKGNFYKLIGNIKNIKIPKIFGKSITHIQLTVSYVDIGIISILIILFFMANILQGLSQFYMAIAFSITFTTFLLQLLLKIMDI